MFWKSYSEKSLSLSILALTVLDKHLTDDVNHNAPSFIPRDNEYLSKNFLESLDNSKIDKARRRLSFNLGLIVGVINHFYDGKDKDFDRFVKKTLAKGILGGKSLIKDLHYLPKKFEKEYEFGIIYSKGFIKRHLESLVSF